MTEFQIKTDDKKSIIGFLDINTLLNNTKNSDLETLKKFLYDVLKSVYSYSNLNEFYSNDKGAIKEVIDGLENIKPELLNKDEKRFSHVP